MLAPFPTRNPALVDALPPEMTGHVSLCYRTEEGDSTLVRLQDLEAYPDLTVQGSLGYLMTSGRLDRFVKTYLDAGLLVTDTSSCRG